MICIEGLKAAGCLARSVCGLACCFAMGGPALIIFGIILVLDKDTRIEKRIEYDNAVDEYNSIMNSTNVRGTIAGVDIRNNIIPVEAKGATGDMKDGFSKVFYVDTAARLETVTYNISGVEVFTRKPLYVKNSKYLGTYCIVVKNNGQEDKTKQSCFYPFEKDDQEYKKKKPDKVRFLLRTSDDPFITLQRITEGSMALPESKTDRNIIGVALIFLGIICLVCLCVSAYCAFSMVNKVMSPQSEGNGTINVSSGQQPQYNNAQNPVAQMSPTYVPYAPPGGYPGAPTATELSPTYVQPVTQPGAAAAAAGAGAGGAYPSLYYPAQTQPGQPPVYPQMYPPQPQYTPIK